MASSPRLFTSARSRPTANPVLSDFRLGRDLGRSLGRGRTRPSPGNLFRCTAARARACATRHARQDMEDGMAEPARNSSCVINVINPNTTESMTALIARAAQASAGPDTRIVGRTSTFGPASIEAPYDDTLA